MSKVLKVASLVTEISKGHYSIDFMKGNENDEDFQRIGGINDFQFDYLPLQECFCTFLEEQSGMPSKIYFIRPFATTSDEYKKMSLSITLERNKAIIDFLIDENDE